MFFVRRRISKVTRRRVFPTGGYTTKEIKILTVTDRETLVAYHWIICRIGKYVNSNWYVYFNFTVSFSLAVCLRLTLISLASVFHIKDIIWHALKMQTRNHRLTCQLMNTSHKSSTKWTGEPNPAKIINFTGIICAELLQWTWLF